MNALHVERDRDEVLLFEMAKDPRAWPGVVSLLKRRPDLVGARGGMRGETPLHWAAITDMGFVMECLSMGGLPTAEDKRGRIPLDWSLQKILFIQEDPSVSVNVKKMTREKMGEVVAVLAGVTDPSFFGVRQGESLALELALRGGCLPAIRAVMDKGLGNLTAKALGAAPFYWCAHGNWEGAGWRETVSLLLSSGFGLDGAVTKDGDTLCLAVARKELENKSPVGLFSMLVENGADPYDEDPSGMDVIEMCSKRKNPEESQRRLGLC